MLDTFPPRARPRKLRPNMRRALLIRIRNLESEQRRAAAEYEGLYARGDAILAEMHDRQQRMRVFHSIMLGRAA